MKRGGKFDELLERVQRGEQLHLQEGVDSVFALLYSARDALTSRRLPDEVELELLLALIDNHLLPGREGRLEGWHGNERQRHLLYAKHLLDAGKQAYGGRRLRDQQVELRLRKQAVKLLKAHFPQTEIERDDLHRFKEVPPAALVAHMDEHMPGAVAKMQAFARSLAGRARGQQGEGAALR